MDEYEKRREVNKTVLRKLGTSAIDNDNTIGNTVGSGYVRGKTTDTSVGTRKDFVSRYDISDYSIFDDASLTIHNLNTSLEDCHDSVQTVKEVLQDRNIFDAERFGF